MLLLLMLASGCSTELDSSIPRAESDVSLAGFFRSGVSSHLSSGTVVRVTLIQRLNSDTAIPGDAWQGVVSAPVIVDGQEEIPAGSTVEGVVSDAVAAGPGRRALLRLALRKVWVNGRESMLYAQSAPVTAGSARARLMHAFSDSQDDPLVLEDGTRMTFTIAHEVALR